MNNLNKKERFQPCFGFSLQRALQIMTFVSMGMNLFGFGCIILDVFQRWSQWQVEKIEQVIYYRIRLTLWIGFVIHGVLLGAMDTILLWSMKSKNVRHLKIYFTGSLMTTTYAVLIFYAQTFILGIHKLALYNGYSIFKFYECFVVYSFIKEVIEENEAASNNRKLSDEEIAMFQNGMDEYCTQNLLSKPLLEVAPYLKFKTEEFEIPLINLRFDKENPLGSGAYGSVYRAQLNKGDGYEITVAVKTVNPEQTDIMYFKALLSELKIMSYVGQHENVVNFIGASTTEIRERKLYIVVEICSLGNMNDYLQGARGLFNNLVRNGDLSQKSDYDTFPLENDSETVTTKDLIKWSYQIACGLEYLESRKVVHGDLATRNVLLTRGRVAKITDFGLARQLYAYSVYVKKQNTPLPWRSLALESLTDMMFSSASDVWAYGVTIWEIFTLGQLPWPGYEFSLKFVEDLKRGLRMNPPHFATNDICALISECWNGSPSERPNFSEIVSFFYKKYPQFISDPSLLSSTSTLGKNISVQSPTPTNSSTTSNNYNIQIKKETEV